MDIHLNDLYPGGYDATNHQRVDTLEISSADVASLWGEKQTYNLILLCQRHKVECLHLGKYRSESSWFALHVEFTDIVYHPVVPAFFYTNLQAIMISDPTSLPINFGMFFARTSVWSIIFILDQTNHPSIQRSIMKNCLKYILGQDWLTNGSNIMEVRFETSDEFALDPPDCDELTKVKRLLVRNLFPREKCKMATIIFLAGKIKKKTIGKDVGGIIALMIWSTRDYPAWKVAK
jgi:hypothetical protein